MRRQNGAATHSPWCRGSVHGRRLLSRYRPRRQPALVDVFAAMTSRAPLKEGSTLGLSELFAHSSGSQPYMSGSGEGGAGRSLEANQGTGSTLDIDSRRSQVPRHRTPVRSPNQRTPRLDRCSTAVEATNGTFVRLTASGQAERVPAPKCAASGRGELRRPRRFGGSRGQESIRSGAALGPCQAHLKHASSILADGCSCGRGTCAAAARDYNEARHYCPVSGAPPDGRPGPPLQSREDRAPGQGRARSRSVGLGRPGPTRR
jgi:hypothetical protein